MSALVIGLLLVVLFLLGSDGTHQTLTQVTASTCADLPCVAQSLQQELSWFAGSMRAPGRYRLGLLSEGLKHNVQPHIAVFGVQERTGNRGQDCKAQGSSHKRNGATFVCPLTTALNCMPR